MTANSPAKLDAHSHLYLIDGSGFIFRAYHALPPLTRKSDGVPVGAVQGFVNMLWKLLSETGRDTRPSHMAVVFDYSAKTFRNAIYPDYKANRSEPPDDLRPQFGLIREATRAFNVACIEKDGFEADDIIATYARAAEAAGATVRIVTSDKDLMQLVSERVRLLDTMKDKESSFAEVMEKFGVAPDRVIDVQALAGDSIDNVPGVPGIGLKTGAELITLYGDLETLLARAGEIKQQKRRENLLTHAEAARLSKRLVTLDDQVPDLPPFADLAVAAPRASDVIGFLKAMEFVSATKKIAAALDADAGAIDAALVPVKFWPPAAGGDSAAATAMVSRGPRPASRSKAEPPDAPADLRARPFGQDVTLITSAAALERLMAEAELSGHMALTTVASSIDAMTAELVGLGLALEPGKAFYLPLNHRARGDGLFGGERLAEQLDEAAALQILKPLLEGPVLKIGHMIKFDRLLLKRRGIELTIHDDPMLLSYVIESNLTGHSLDDLAERHLGHRPRKDKEVLGQGRNALTPATLPPADAAALYGEDADIALRLWATLRPMVQARGKVTVYETLERALIGPLVEMEFAGVTVDRQVLARLSSLFAQKQAGVEDDLFRLAGDKFNPGSAKQLADILFERMKLAGGRKTATGQWSTDADVLEELAGSGVEIAQRALDWRMWNKLATNYTDALPGYINRATGRVHTSYAMASTTTGRLSSTEPNLQVIPIRTDEGREIRRAFVAPPGSKLISADYSQIELRVLAHVADIPQLKTAFAEGLDIHAMTASEMFGVPVQGMDPAVRRRAKAINFGIVYGISAFGLANQLGISREEAGQYIKTYFQRFPGIRDYMEAMKAEAHARGHVETIFGRRCHFPKVKSPNASERSNAERAAINAPIQGSAADIIRRAMVRMIPALRAEGLGTHMLLQVHDELVFEALDKDVEASLPIIRRVMEQAAEPAVRLSVPLQVDARAAQNWDEAH
jgi:DNA polymerase-1